MAALAVKDEQYQRVSEYNMELLKTLNTLDDEKKSLQLEKLGLEEENRVLREKNFEMQSKVRASETQMRKSENELESKDKQHKIMTDHNSELLRLLEKLEFDKATLDQVHMGLKQELDDLRGKYSSLLSTAKTHENMATQAAHQGQLRAEEVRLLRAEAEQLRNANLEMKMKTQVEVESLQDQLRITKEKQYQLLQKLQSDEEAKHQAEDQVAAMEEKLRILHEKKVELDTQLQVEIRAKKSQQDSNKALTIEIDNYGSSNKDLQEKIGRSEQERLRIEAESRDTNDQLTAMSEKVFQLLERMKLSEMGKKKAIDALKTKEQELVSLQKKNSRLLKESTKEGKARVKAELDKKVMQDQIQALKKHNSRLNNKCGEEVKKRLKLDEELKNTQEKLKVLGGRLSFLLKKMEADEEAKIVNKEEMKKMQAQLNTMQERAQELQASLSNTTENNRMITQAMRLKQEELDELKVKFDALQSKYLSKSLGEAAKDSGGQNQDDDGLTHDDLKSISGKGHFYVECKASQGMILLKPKQHAHKSGKGLVFLDRHRIAPFLKRAQKSNNVKQLLVEKLGHLLSMLMDEEAKASDQVQKQQAIDDHIHHLTQKISFMQERLSSEEDAKRRTLLRYIHSVKTASTVASDSAEQSSASDLSQILLPESGVGDEEVHAIAALIRGNMTIRRLILTNNSVTNEGARALAAILAVNNNLESIDLRGNNIDGSGINALAEALERNKRIRHVYVHGGGKIVGLGAIPKQTTDSTAKVEVETACVVDVRDNETNEDKESHQLEYTNSLSMRSAPIVPITSPNRAKFSAAQALERKREQDRLKRQRKVKKVEKERQVAGESKWAGRVGGLVNNLPPLNSDGKSKSIVDSATTDDLSPSRHRSPGRNTGYSRRLRDSPLGATPKAKDSNTTPD